MAYNDARKIYLISGPCGVGKSTVAKQLSRKLQHSALINGDAIMAMVEEGNEPPWEQHLSLTWNNIVALTRNFVEHGYHVAIDFVVENELEWFCKHTSDLNVEIHYVVLRADEAALIERLQNRGDDYLIDRSLFLLKQLESSAANSRHLLDTTRKQPAEIVEDLVSDTRFMTMCRGNNELQLKG